MTYTYELKQVLQPYNGVLYKMNELRIILSDGKFEHRAMPVSVIVTNGTITIKAFMCIISGNQQELLAYFTTDAFTVFTGSAVIKFGYGDQQGYTIEGVDVHNPLLPASLATIPHQTANNAWLQQQ